jgi:mutator protein MutT
MQTSKSDDAIKQAACAILIHEGEILLGKRAAHKQICPNKWDIVGGHLEPGETPVQALLREVLEELGVTIEEFGEFHTMIEQRVEFGGPAVFHVYLVKRWTGRIAMLGNEHAELRWFAIHEACALPDLAHPDYPRIFRDISIS